MEVSKPPTSPCRLWNSFCEISSELTTRTVSASASFSRSTDSASKASVFFSSRAKPYSLTSASFSCSLRSFTSFSKPSRMFFLVAANSWYSFAVPRVSSSLSSSSATRFFSSPSSWVVMTRFDDESTSNSLTFFASVSASLARLPSMIPFLSKVLFSLKRLYFSSAMFSISAWAFAKSCFRMALHFFSSASCRVKASTFNRSSANLASSSLQRFSKIRVVSTPSWYLDSILLMSCTCCSISRSRTTVLRSAMAFLRCTSPSLASSSWTRASSCLTATRALFSRPLCMSSSSWSLSLVATSSS
mmetsp:Transcript_85777/g.136245  ORF Transcript_85777/g.136245 Transcript_85777/m.136245 type:complete len:302 (-) Transcript_85777:640-1545(-)